MRAVAAMLALAAFAAASGIPISKRSLTMADAKSGALYVSSSPKNEHARAS